LAALDATAVATGWSETFPGFTLGASRVASYQSNPALQYEGTSPGSDQGGPITLVHTETVDGGNGYTLDCFYATEMAAEARPIVDSIIANFSTRQDAQPVVTP
jgi:ABC-type thiamine transport system substrate-binding protein